MALRDDYIAEFVVFLRKQRLDRREVFIGNKAEHR